MSLFSEIIMVALGGALGAALRFIVSRWVQGIVPHDFPYGILGVNIIGSFLIGVVAAGLATRFELSTLARAFVIIGVFGGFTTFSSFSLDTFTLFEAGRPIAALSNVGVSLFACLAATALGAYLIRWVI